MALTKLEKSLIDAVSKQHPIQQYERDLVSKYVEFGKIWEDLGMDVVENGVMIDVINGSNTFRKVNPAVQEKQKISASMTAILRTLGIDSKGLTDTALPSKGGGLLD